ncbi:uncharacterized protein EDB91DRAFT_1131120 [Suillus paluster]|uniref:uncharacterized protein n=1 Tax=Suillus paluster TaxID=48578 RepID=UPI001B883355|nr:uncharacterized protein EDB91DRAFT_1131120 [Suillus paluster]KAG1741554.1 hypothetical protein EDB91DRAFT_1131120 [Suillus paluster]
MDVDDPPPASLAKSNEPSRQLATSQRYREDRDGSAPKRPRAMMDDTETSARRRSPDRPWKEPYRPSHDDVSRGRDEPRARAEPSTRTSRETTRRQVDMSRPPPSAPTPKLSGTNSMPIGGRSNRFAGSASISPHPPPPPSAPFPPSVTSASRRGTHVSGSHAQLVVSRPVRPPTGAKESHERPPHLDDVRDRERSTQIPAEPRRQNERVVSPHLPRKPLDMPDAPVNVPINTDLQSRSGGRPSRTRFGPPVARVEEKLDPTNRRGQTPESPQSHHYDDRATPPPLSRDSSMTSLRDGAHPSQQSKHHGEISPRDHRLPEPRSHAPERNEEKDLPDHPRSSGRKDHYDHGPSSLDHTTERRADESQWSRSRDLPPRDSPPRDSSRQHADVVSLPSGQHAANGEGSQVQQSLPLAMHPERARLLQHGTLPHSLPPRPETEPRRPRSTRPRHDSTPWASSGSRSNQPFEDIHFTGDRLDRSSSNRGNSLIDRLAVDGGPPSFSLRDRVKVPMKRPLDDMTPNEAAMDIDDGYEAKRSRRRGGKPKKPRRVV